MVASSGAIDVDVDHLCIDMNQLLHGCIRGTSDENQNDKSGAGVGDDSNDQDLYF